MAGAVIDEVTRLRKRNRVIDIEGDAALFHGGELNGRLFRQTEGNRLAFVHAEDDAIRTRRSGRGDGVRGFEEIVRSIRDRPSIVGARRADHVRESESAQDFDDFGISAIIIRDVRADRRELAIRRDGRRSISGERLKIRHSHGALRLRKHVRRELTYACRAIPFRHRKIISHDDLMRGARDQIRILRVRPADRTLDDCHDGELSQPIGLRHGQRRC